jgi:hypothetical protein
MATAGNDGIVGAWNITTGKQTTVFDCRATRLSDLAFRFDGRTLVATKSNVSDLRLIDVNEKDGEPGHPTTEACVKRPSWSIVRTRRVDPSSAHPNVFSREFGFSEGRSTMNGLLRALLLLGLPGQAPAADTPADVKARLEFMKKCMATHDVHALDGRDTPFRLQAEPVLRFTNPVGGSRDGAMFVWLGEGDRPVVAAQMLWTPEQIWMEEFSSLSTNPLIAKSADRRVWSPSKAGVSFKLVTEAPKPAETAERRLRQMRELADGFSAEHFYKGKTWNKLRMLTKPFARYGKPGSEVQDGALFCFAHGTDPEVLLMLESRPGKDGPEWHYAFAPMTTFAVNTFWKGKEVWSLPPRADGAAGDPRSTFHQRETSIKDE